MTTAKNGKAGASNPGPTSVKVPRAPTGLTAKSRSIWRDVHATYELNEAETELLALALRHPDIADRGLLECAKFGLTIESANGGIRRANPAHKAAPDSMRAYRMALEDLGVRDVEIG